VLRALTLRRSACADCWPAVSATAAAAGESWPA
jgi:hypothetical protein